MYTVATPFWYPSSAYSSGGGSGTGFCTATTLLSKITFNELPSSPITAVKEQYLASHGIKFIGNTSKGEWRTILPTYTGDTNPPGETGFTVGLLFSSSSGPTATGESVRAGSMRTIRSDKQICHIEFDHYGAFAASAYRADGTLVTSINIQATGGTEIWRHYSWALSTFPNILNPIRVDYIDFTGSSFQLENLEFTVVP